MTKVLRIIRQAVAMAVLLVSPVPAFAQQIQLDVVTVAVSRSLSGEPAITATLSAESRQAFAEFSRRVAGRSIEIRSAGDILAVVLLQTSIEGGVLQFIVRDRMPPRWRARYPRMAGN